MFNPRLVEGGGNGCVWNEIDREIGAHETSNGVAVHRQTYYPYTVPVNQIRFRCRRLSVAEVKFASPVVIFLSVL